MKEAATVIRGYQVDEKLKAMCDMPKDRIIAFIDGSCMLPGKKGARAGYGIVFPDYQEYNKKRKLTGVTQTNNRAELTAFIEAVTTINGNIDPGRTRKKLIYTDCMLLVQMLQGGIAKRCLFGWKHTSNADLLKQIDGIMKVEGNLLTVVHVYAHTGKDDWKSKWNAEADKAAKEGADMHQHLDHGNIPFINPQESRYKSMASSRPHSCTSGSIGRRVLPRYGT